jgi:hypothetical protein
MKQAITLLGLFLITCSLHAQTVEHKSCFSFGGGNESYNGHLGNSWFDPGEEWYGFVHMAYSRYLCKSFDVQAGITYGDIGRCRPDGADPSILNLYTRMTSTSLTFKYKFANGYLLNEKARVAPYVFLGGAVNNLPQWRSRPHRQPNLPHQHGIFHGLCLYDYSRSVRLHHHRQTRLLYAAQFYNGI